MGRWIAFAAMVGASAQGLAAADPYTGIGFKIGYYQGRTFDGVGDETIGLSGAAVGIDIPLTRLGRTATLRFSPSMMGGGVLGHGVDADANLYRMMLAAEFGGLGGRTYWILGAGFGFAHERGVTRIPHRSGFVAQLGFGMRMAGRIRGGEPYAEISLHAGSETFQGIGVYFGLRF
jgi:hypothetical protein